MSLPEEIKHREVVTLRFNLKSKKRFQLLIKVGLPGIGAKLTNISIQLTQKKRLELYIDLDK
jgi:hypothetical protein